ncbi:helix-turn-helix domain-containing protein [Thermomonospora cellulosilytica]|uniref:Transcriptional regulator with XRE-family HTH domain n=1 Tax=Thermomonospora cellulosilytica TaxID=1411118 RepID=A0A7W3R6S1_9ACTN|nr:helix-turn-helix domain-containing protein [Thermomonospora cellulosilytica]MBA9001846.1 transcriptional regulator with XRE-family HTH domain [Thermomonospora cellulosilytica]
MAVNERLRSALLRAGMSYAQFAEAVGVDPKTAERWVSTGRTPHRSTAYKAARVLREDMAYLWPSIEQGRRRRGLHPGLVGFHDTRADAPFELWRTLFEQAGEVIDILVYAGVFIHEQWPDFNDLLREKAAHGCRVRVLLGDADAPAIIERGREEKYGHGIESRCRVALMHYRPLVGTPGIDIHLHATTLYNSIYRGDDQMLVNAHVFGMNAYGAPLWHLRRDGGSRVFDVYAESFEAVWESSRPAGGE